MPIYLFMVYLGWSPAWYFIFTCFYGACNAAVFTEDCAQNRGGKSFRKKRESISLVEKNLFLI